MKNGVKLTKRQKIGMGTFIAMLAIGIWQGYLPYAETQGWWPYSVSKPTPSEELFVGKLFGAVEDGSVIPTEPIGGVEVKVKDPLTGWVSESVLSKTDDGKYSFESLRAGPYDLEARHTDYEPYPYTSAVKVPAGRAEEHLIELVPKKAKEETTVVPGPPFSSFPDWAKTSTNAEFGITVTALSSPRIATLSFAGTEKEIVLMDISIMNQGNQTLYLDLRQARLTGQLPGSQYFVDLLSYDSVSSLLTEQGLKGPVIKLEPYQEPLVGTIAFEPIVGTILPTNIESTAPLFWGMAGPAKVEQFPIYSIGLPSE